jgi:hypothetical protein
VVPIIINLFSQVDEVIFLEWQVPENRNHNECMDLSADFELSSPGNESPSNLEQTGPQKLASKTYKTINLMTWPCNGKQLRRKFWWYQGLGNISWAASGFLNVTDIISFCYCIYVNKGLVLCIINLYLPWVSSIITIKAFSTRLSSRTTDLKNILIRFQAGQKSTNLKIK